MSSMLPLMKALNIYRFKYLKNYHENFNSNRYEDADPFQKNERLKDYSSNSQVKLYSTSARIPTSVGSEPSKSSSDALHRNTYRKSDSTIAKSNRNHIDISLFYENLLEDNY